VNQLAPPARGLPLRWFTLAAMAMSTFIGTWDVSAPVVAVPAITRQFNVGVDSAVWVLTVESLMFAVPLALFGKLGDMFGHKRTYLISAGAFVIVTWLAASARGFGWLIFFRALQGLANAPGYAATMALIGSSFPLAERGRAMGFHGMAAALGWALGPILGGLIMLRYAWQALLWAEVPLMALAFVLAWRLMPDDAHASPELGPAAPRPVEARRAARPRFDLVGAVSLTISSLLLMFGLAQVGETGWTGGPTLALAGGFVALIGLFLYVERRHPAPFVPLSLFGNGRFSAAALFSAIQLTIMLAITLLVPVYLQEVNGVDPATAGLAVTMLSLARVVFAPVAGRLAEVLGPRLPTLAASGLLLLIALGFAVWLTPLTPGWLIFAAMFAAGAGVSFTRIPVNAAATHLVSPANLGLAMGVFSMVTFAGGSLGQTFFGALLRTLSGAGSAPLAAAARPDLLGAFTVSFAVVMGLAAAAGALGLLLPSRMWAEA